jgi:hypothetical protein
MMVITEKSRGASFALTLLLGPLGLLYATVPGGIVLTVVAILTAPTGIGPIVCWIVAMATGDYAVREHNAAVQQFAASINRR